VGIPVEVFAARSALAWASAGSARRLHEWRRVNAGDVRTDRPKPLSYSGVSGGGVVFFGDMAGQMMAVDIVVVGWR
jgi:hypothetical protein